MDFFKRIEELKKAKNAVILAHYYQVPEIQDCADFVGDSLELCRKSAETDAKIIVFCGVRFMAETAALFNPDKKVLHPEPKSDCPMARMITEEPVLRWKKENPGGLVVCYVNSTTEVKAVSDICCTSSNAVKVIESLPSEKPVFFIPDRHLGSYVKEITGRNITLCDGFCPTHVKILPADLEKAKKDHPGALSAVHPECPKAVRDAADFVGSTAQIINWCLNSSAKDFIIGTESGILHSLRKQAPEKKFFAPPSGALCPNMKMITLDKVLRCLEEETGLVVIKKELREKALAPISRMLAL